jgi:hypothetical protein
VGQQVLGDGCATDNWGLIIARKASVGVKHLRDIVEVALLNQDSVAIELKFDISIVLSQRSVCLLRSVNNQEAAACELHCECRSEKY